MEPSNRYSTSNLARFDWYLWRPFFAYFYLLLSTIIYHQKPSVPGKMSRSQGLLNFLGASYLWCNALILPRKPKSAPAIKIPFPSWCRPHFRDIRKYQDKARKILKNCNINMLRSRTQLNTCICYGFVCNFKIGLKLRNFASFVSLSTLFYWQLWSCKSILCQGHLNSSHNKEVNTICSVGNLFRFIAQTSEKIASQYWPPYLKTTLIITQRNSVLIWELGHFTSSLIIVATLRVKNVVVYEASLRTTTPKVIVKSQFRRLVYFSRARKSPKYFFSSCMIICGFRKKNHLHWKRKQVRGQAQVGLDLNSCKMYKLFFLLLFRYEFFLQNP